MYLLTGLRCDDYDRALASSMAKPMGTVVLVKSVPLIVYFSVRMAYSCMACWVDFHFKGLLGNDI